MDDIRIVFLQRGNVLVGRYSCDGMECRLDGASVIRRWGTTKGIGQLAREGPKSETVLDPAGIVRWHVLTGIMTIDCDPAVWREHVT